MIDLHLHLDGSLSIDDMLTLAKMNHVDENTILKEKIHADEEIKNLLEQVKYKISSEYIKKKKYLIKFENMPE